METVACPTCGARLEVSVYYAPPDDSVGLSHDYEVTILDGDCEHELTPKQEAEIFDELWERGRERAAAHYEDERYARGYDDL